MLSPQIKNEHNKSPDYKARALKIFEIILEKVLTYSYEYAIINTERR
jgi:hypothetical protein